MLPSHGRVLCFYIMGDIVVNFQLAVSYEQVRPHMKNCYKKLTMVDSD